MNKKFFEDIEKSIKKIDFEELKNKTFFLTGATGLIGRAVLDILIYLRQYKGYEIDIVLALRDIDRAKDILKECKDLPYIKYVKYDATKNLDKINYKIDYILHMASNAQPNLFDKEPVETMLANFTGLYNLAMFAKDNKVKRILYVSSSEVYGSKDDLDLYKENDFKYIDILNYRSSYPSSKRAAETLLAAFKKEYDLDSVIVRPGHIYGPTMTKNDNRFSAYCLKTVSSGQNIIMKSEGSQLRSHCHCIDCANAILIALLKGESTKAYNISNKNSLSTVREYATTCANIGNVKIEFDIPTDIEKLSFSPMQSAALDASLLESLGFCGYFNLEDGIKETLSVIKDA